MTSKIHVATTNGVLKVEASAQVTRYLGGAVLTEVRLISTSTMSGERIYPIGKLFNEIMTEVAARAEMALDVQKMMGMPLDSGPEAG